MRCPLLHSHPRQKRVHAMDHPEEVHRQHPAPVLHAGLRDRPDDDDPGVIDEDVDLTELIVGDSRQRLDGIRIAHVRGHGEGSHPLRAQRPRNGLGRLPLNVGNDDVRARGGERDRRAAADPAAPSGHDRDLPAEFRHRTSWRQTGRIDSLRVGAGNLRLRLEKILTFGALETVWS